MGEEAAAAALSASVPASRDRRERGAGQLELLPRSRRREVRFGLRNDSRNRRSAGILVWMDGNRQHGAERRLRRGGCPEARWRRVGWSAGLAVTRDRRVKGLVLS